MTVLLHLLLQGWQRVETFRQQESMTAVLGPS